MFEALKHQYKITSEAIIDLKDSDDFNELVDKIVRQNYGWVCNDSEEEEEEE